MLTDCLLDSHELAIFLLDSISNVLKYHELEGHSSI